MKVGTLLSLVVGVLFALSGCQAAKSGPEVITTPPQAKAANAYSVVIGALKPLGVEPEKAATLSDVLCTHASALPKFKDVVCASDLQAITANSEMSALMGGCDNDDCFSAVGQAAQRPYVIGGTIGKVGEQLVINLNLVDTAKQSAVKRSSIQVGKDGNLIDAVKQAADELGK